MIIGFTGTRQGMTELQRLAITKLMMEARRDSDAQWLHHGGAQGADAQAHWIWLSMDGRIHLHPGQDFSGDVVGAELTNWDRSSIAKPFLIRNKDIVNACTLLIATPAQTVNIPRGSGTWATIRYARKIGRPTTILWPDGTGQQTA